MKPAEYFPPAGADDASHANAAARFGFYCAACAVAGLDPDVPHTSKEFDRANPYVHQAIRNGDIAPDLTTPTPMVVQAADGTRREVVAPSDVIFKT
jgi:hypothetical protein